MFMEIVAIIVGLLAGFALMAMFVSMRMQRIDERRQTEQVETTARLIAEQETRILQLQSQVAEQQNASFLNIAKAHLQQETARGEEQLKARQGEIDQNLEAIRKELLQVREYVANTDSERNKSIASLAAVTERTNKVAEALRQDTQKLNETLAGGQARGQWGERMAEDVLRVAGFIEGVNYRKQEGLEDGGRPDFTFLLPEDKVLHMDVKFPGASYLRYMEAESDADRERAAKDFMRDVKQRITEVTTREYIDPAAGTLDYTLVFIPNEQVYGFIQEQDPAVIDYALENRVVVCSPLTLFAVLAVIRQAMENFRLAKRTDEILSVLGSFNKQWDMYKGQMQKLGNAIGSVQRNYEELEGKRSRALDRQVKRIEDLRGKGGDLEPGDEPDVEAELLELAAGENEIVEAEAVAEETESPLF
jgi:DNA recombination protein RmuC